MQKVKLIEICFPKQWKTISTNNLLSEGYPVYGANGVIGYYNEYNHEFPTIMITCRGATCGTINISSPKAYINGNAMCLDKLREDVDIYYLYYCLVAYDFSSVISGTAQPQITRESLAKVNIPLPPMEEQRAIAEKLDKVSQLVDKRKEQLQQLDQLVKSQFIDMFGDLITNSKAWDFLPLGKICDVRDGTHESPKYCKEGYPLLTSKNFTDGKVNFFGANFISEKDFISINSRSKVDYGDIVMPMIGTIGHPVIVSTRKPFAIKNVALIKFSGSNFLNVFIKAILESDYFLSLIKSKNRGNTQKFISLGDIREISIPIVSKSEQIKFAGFVERVEKIKEKVNNSLAQLNLLKQSLMQQYFG